MDPAAEKKPTNLPVCASCSLSKTPRLVAPGWNVLLPLFFSISERIPKNPISVHKKTNLLLQDRSPAVHLKIRYDLHRKNTSERIGRRTDNHVQRRIPLLRRCCRRDQRRVRQDDIGWWRLLRGTVEGERTWRRRNVWTVCSEKKIDGSLVEWFPQRQRKSHLRRRIGVLRRFLPKQSTRQRQNPVLRRHHLRGRFQGQPHGRVRYFDWHQPQIRGQLEGRQDGGRWQELLVQLGRWATRDLRRRVPERAETRDGGVPLVERKSVRGVVVARIDKGEDYGGVKIVC